MMRDRQIKTVTLLGFGENNQVNLETIQRVRAKYLNIRYVHIDAHGTYEWDARGWFTGDALRTVWQFNDGYWPCYNSRRWTDRGYDVPAGYEYLSGNMETASTFEDFGFRLGEVIILVSEACYGVRNLGVLNPDFTVDYDEDAIQWEEDHHQAYPYNDRFFTDICYSFYIGNDKQIALGSSAKLAKSAFYPYWQRFFNAFWQSLAEGNNADDAKDTALAGMPYDVTLNLRIRGAIGDLYRIYLTSAPN